jgi:hypothetical protein
MAVVAHLTGSEDQLNLKPGDGSGKFCHRKYIPLLQEHKTSMEHGTNNSTGTSHE